MMSELELRAKLVYKIANYAAALGKMAPDGVNTFSNYRYISSEQVLTHNRGKFCKSGFYIIPEVEAISEREITMKTKVYTRTLVKMNFEIVDIETGFSLVKKFVGIDQDIGGKSCGQTITEACKRFYLKLFNISSGELDPDSKTVDINNIN